MYVRTLKSMVLALFLCITGMAQATITVYTNQALFLGAISAPGTDTYNDLPLSSVASPLLRTAGPYSYTGTVSTTSFFMAGSVGDVWLSTNTATDSITLNAIPANVRGIGGQFFGSDISGNYLSGDITVTATDASGTVTQTTLAAPPANFIGFVSNGPLTSLTVTAVQPPAVFMWPTVNNLVMGLAAPPPATHFSVSAPAGATPGSSFNYTVTALDASNATATGYTGTVHFTSSDGAAVLPANATLTNGVGTFSATLNTVGNQTITATDTVTAAITGTSGPIAVGVSSPPVLVSAVLSKVHGVAGTFDLPLSIAPPTNINPTTEPRAGPNHRIVYTFDKPITAATVVGTGVVEGTISGFTPTVVGGTLVVDYTGVTDIQYVTFRIATASAGAATGGPYDVRVGFLFGDTNQSRQVTVADVGIINSVLLQVVSNANFLRDINVDGKLTVADKGLSNSVLLHKLPAP